MNPKAVNYSPNTSSKEQPHQDLELLWRNVLHLPSFGYGTIKDWQKQESDNILNYSLFLKNHANVAQPGRASDL